MSMPTGNASSALTEEATHETQNTHLVIPVTLFAALATPAWLAAQVGGSGTTILAAERTGRIARLIELDPLYVDVTVLRWQAMTGVPARHATSGLSFEQVAAERGAIPEPADPAE